MAGHFHSFRTQTAMRPFLKIRMERACLSENRATPGMEASAGRGLHQLTHSTTHHDIRKQYGVNRQYGSSCGLSLARKYAFLALHTTTLEEKPR